MASADSKATQLFYISCLFAAINRSYRDKENTVYTSGDSDSTHALGPFQSFLCKLAQVCDNEKKGGDTATALVVLNTANGPDFLLASNNRKEVDLRSTETFLSGLLSFIGTNPDGLAEKALQRKVLWLILEFNFHRVDFYLKKVVALVGECIERCHPHIMHNGSKLLQSLQELESKASFPRDMFADGNAKAKFLSDCESLIKAIHLIQCNGVGEMISRYVDVGDAGDVDERRPWCEFRHYLGRMHSYRRAAECSVKASQKWPELFANFEVSSVKSNRPSKISLPKPLPSALDAMHDAFPDMDLGPYLENLENLQEHGLDRHFQEELRLKSKKQPVHCEVLLHDFLLAQGKEEPSDYWNDSMFIATSKPPCRHCHYYFDDPDNDFQVQASHMNVYPKWRLPDIRDDQGEEAREKQDELLEDLIDQIKQDTLRLVEEQVPQWKRHDSRTESRGLSTRASVYSGERCNIWNSGHGTDPDERFGQETGFQAQHMESAASADSYDFLDVGAAI